MAEKKLYPDWAIKAGQEADKLVKDVDNEKIQASQQKESRVKSLLFSIEQRRKYKADIAAARSLLKADEVKAAKAKEERIKRLAAEIEKDKKEKAIQAEIEKVKKSMTPEEIKKMEVAQLEAKKKKKKEEEEKKKAEAAVAVADEPQGVQPDKANVALINKESKDKELSTDKKLNVEEEEEKKKAEAAKTLTKEERISQLKAAIKAKRLEAEELKKKLEAAPKLSEKDIKKVKEEKVTEETTRFQKTSKTPEEVKTPAESAEPITEDEKKLFEDVIETINKLTEITNAKQAEMKKVTDAFKDPEYAQSKAVEQAIENYYNHAKVNNKLGDLAKLTEERFVGVYERLKGKSKKYTKEEQEKIDKIAREIKQLQEKKKELENLLGKYNEFTREITVLELEKKPKQVQVKTSINAEDTATMADNAEAIEKGTGILEQIVNVLKDMLKIGNKIEQAVPVAASQEESK